jgi:hypothetical protein
MNRRFTGEKYEETSFAVGGEDYIAVNGDVEFVSIGEISVCVPRIIGGVEAQDSGVVYYLSMLEIGEFGGIVVSEAGEENQKNDRQHKN